MANNAEKPRIPATGGSTESDSLSESPPPYIESPSPATLPIEPLPDSSETPSKTQKAWRNMKTAVVEGKAKDIALAAYHGGLEAKKTYTSMESWEVTRGGGKGTDEAMKLAKAAFAGGMEAKKTWEKRKGKREAKMVQDLDAAPGLGKDIDMHKAEGKTPKAKSAKQRRKKDEAADAEELVSRYRF